MLYRIFPSMALSATPVTIIVWAVFQFPGVKVTDEAEAVPSKGFEDEIPIVTSAVGSDVSTIEKAAVPPASVVVKPLVGFTVMPATSLSIFDKETSEAFRLL